MVFRLASLTALVVCALVASGSHASPGGIKGARHLQYKAPNKGTTKQKVNGATVTIYDNPTPTSASSNVALPSNPLEPLTSAETGYLCGCKECGTVLNNQAGEFTCGERITGLVQDWDFNEADACERVAKVEYSTICGPFCDPERCDGRVAVEEPPKSYCGCKYCTQEVWNRITTEFTCGARISYLTDLRNVPQDDACHTVGGEQYPLACGACDPTICEKEDPTEITVETVDQAGNVDVDFQWQIVEGAYEVEEVEEDTTGNAAPVGSNIQTEAEAETEAETVEEETVEVTDSPPTQVEETKEDEALSSMESEQSGSALFNTANSADEARENNAAGQRCGCNECTEQYWLADAAGFTCQERIEYLQTAKSGIYPTEIDACRQVAQVEFANACSGCNPDRCDGRDVKLTPESSLYCFPDYSERTRWENVWGDFILEVKEGEVCGPSDNKWTTNTVSLNNEDELKMQIKKVNGKWEASEVRVVLPEVNMPYRYGEYSFSVKSVEVIDSTDGSVISNVLPPSIILGLFTWDATEIYAIHENYNHEVDIEIARWNDQSNADVQFLVQPVGDPQKYRFFSGVGGTYDQAPHTYAFDWRPGEVEWYSTAGGGQQFTYNVQMALDAGAEDYTQCMPADVEVRLNLWNLLGTSTPTAMRDTHVVEVVIDNFTYTPNGLTALEDGGVCTKNCQCGPTSQCINNKCTYVEPNINPEGSDEGVTVDWLQGSEVEQRPSGMGPAGISILVILLAVVCLAVAFLVVRKRSGQKQVTEEGKKSIFQAPFPGRTGQKEILVDCWEEEKAGRSSFEMSLHTLPPRRC